MIWLALLVGFVGGIGGALTLAFGETAWYALSGSRWWLRANNAWIGWQVRRSHRRSGRL